MKTLPIIAIVGRPNVGKSTLFNRLVGERHAIVAETAGTTRDRLYADADFGGREVTVVDTGGLEMDLSADLPGTPTAMLALVRAQASAAIEDADVIIYVVDAEQGMLPDDFEIAQVLRQTAKPTYLVANKADNETRRQDAVEFFQLGIGEPLPISALHGIGVGDLLDEIVPRLPERNEAPRSELQIAIVGRPNVGKSSLLNAILGEDRAIVSEIPGTTRDTLDTLVLWRGQPILLIDTAGLRKRGRIVPGIEKYSSIRALRAIQRAQIALLVLDVVDGVTAQDQHVASYILDAGRGVVIVMNKWDLIEKDAQTMVEHTDRVRAALDFIEYAPLVFASAKTRQRVSDVIDAALRVHEAWNLRVPTSELNELMRETTARHAPPTRGKRPLKFYYATQVEGAPPTFVFFVNDRRLVHFTYQRYLENQLRARWGFVGAPLKMIFRSRRSKR